MMPAICFGNFGYAKPLIAKPNKGNSGMRNSKDILIGRNLRLISFSIC